MASNGNEPVDSAAVSAEADVLYEKGVAAIKSGAMDDAIELLAKALELKTTAHGEEAVECAPAYYKYGCALFYKAQDENTVFGKQAQAQADAKDEAARKASGSGAADEGEACDDADDAPEGDAAKDGDAEAEEEEEEDDMELAWKLIENARLIYEEAEDHPIELANCYETLGEINTEHSNFKERSRTSSDASPSWRRNSTTTTDASPASSVPCPSRIRCSTSTKRRSRGAPAPSACVALASSDSNRRTKPPWKPSRRPSRPARRRRRTRSRRPRRNSTRSRRCSAISPRARRNFAGSSARITTRANRSKGVRRHRRCRCRRGILRGRRRGRGGERRGFAAPKLTTGATAPVNLGVVGKSAGAARVSAAPVVGGGSKEPKRVNLAPVVGGGSEGTQACQPRACRRGARPRRLVRRGGRRRLRGDERCVRTRARERFGRARGEEGEGGSGGSGCGGPRERPGRARREGKRARRMQAAVSAPRRAARV